MTNLANQPTNPNFLAGHNFRLILNRAPHLMFFTQKFDLPEVAIKIAEQSTPFGPIFHHGTQMDNPRTLDLTFKIDEDFANYLEIYEWMMGLGFPDGFDQFKALNANPIASGKWLYSDGTLTVLSSAKNPNIEVRFERMFPIALSTVNFDTTSEADYLDCTVTFKFQQFYIKKVG